MISSKINTLLQLLYVLAVVAHAGYGLPPQGVVDALALVDASPPCCSAGCAYVREFTRRALQVRARLRTLP